MRIFMNTAKLWKALSQLMTGILFTGLVLAASACSRSEEQDNPGRRAQALPDLPVQIVIDDAATIKFDDSGDDFVLVFVTFNTQEFGIYAGNHPSTPLDPEQSRNISSVIGADYPVFCSDSSSEDGLSGHCLVELRDELSYPAYLHFFYNDFQAESVAEVMAVIASVEVLDTIGL